MIGYYPDFKRAVQPAERPLQRNLCGGARKSEAKDSHKRVFRESSVNTKKVMATLWRLPVQAAPIVEGAEDADSWELPSPSSS